MFPGLIALFAGPAILIPLACYALAHRQVRGASWYALLLLTISVWSLAYAWELSATDVDAKLLALKSKYVAVVLVPSGWIGFILSFLGSPSARVWRRVLPVTLVSAVLLVFAWTNEWHGWFWGPLSLYPIGGGYSVLQGRGLLFWVNVVYTYCVLGTGIVLLALHAFHSPYLYRRSARILVMGAVVPWAGNLVFVLRQHDVTVDPTPFLFTCTAVIAALAVFRYELFEPVPTLSDARIEAVGDGIVILDRRRRIADLNPAAEAFLGRSRAEAGGTVIDRLLPGWTADSLDASSTDVTISRQQGPRIYDVRSSEVRSRAGEPTGAVIVLRDVTERRLAERALRESELRYRTVIEQASDGVWVANRESTIVDVNPGACAMLGYTRAELVGRRAADLIDPQEKDGLPLPVDGRGADAIDWQRRVVAKNGRRLLLAGRSTQIAPDLVVSTFRDITEERAEAEHRERLLLNAQEVIRLKDEFLAMVSHELRTPIAAVLGWTRMLVRYEVEPARVAHALGVIERNALAQARLVDDLLDVSLMAGGRLHLTLVETDLNALVREALDAIGPSAQAKGVSLDVHLPSSLPRSVVDSGRIQQVLWNLLSNAIKFTPSGGTVAVSSAATPEGVELIVRDTGRGIAPDFLPFVFDPFRQGESSAARSLAGLGLGLAIVRRIVEAHGGRVEAASDGPGTGATFRVQLPAIPTPVGPHSVNDGRSSTGGDATVGHIKD